MSAQSHKRPIGLAHVLSGLDVTDLGALSVDGQTPKTRGENRSQAVCRREARLIGYPRASTVGSRLPPLFSRPVAGDTTASRASGV